MSSKGSNSPLTAAERMRIHRKRRQNGLYCVRILLHETEINALVHGGFLRHERRHDRAAVESAINSFICYSFGDSNQA